MEWPHYEKRKPRNSITEKQFSDEIGYLLPQNKANEFHEFRTQSNYTLLLRPAFLTDTVDPLLTSQLSQENDERLLNRLEDVRMVAEDECVCYERPSASRSIPRPAIAGSLKDLWQACEQGNVEFVARLITKMNVDANSLNQHRRTPLSIAASHRRDVVV
jgi:hypothetical protein